MFHSLPPCVACCRNLCKTGASIRDQYDQVCAVIHVVQAAKVGAHAEHFSETSVWLKATPAVERCDPTRDVGECLHWSQVKISWVFGCCVLVPWFFRLQCGAQRRRSESRGQLRSGTKGTSRDEIQAATAPMGLSWKH